MFFIYLWLSTFYYFDSRISDYTGQIVTVKYLNTCIVKIISIKYVFNVSAWTCGIIGITISNRHTGGRMKTCLVIELTSCLKDIQPNLESIISEKATQAFTGVGLTSSLRKQETPELTSQLSVSTICALNKSSLPLNCHTDDH